MSRPHQNCIEQLDYKADTSCDMDWLNWSIRTACAEGKVVVVNNWPPECPPMLFDPPGVSMVYDVNGIMEWQGEYNNELLCSPMLTSYQKMQLYVIVIFTTSMPWTASCRDAEFMNFWCTPQTTASAEMFSIFHILEAKLLRL